MTLNPAQFKPFTLVIRSQVATGTLPFAQRVGLLSVEGAASQIGLLGVATGNEVQLDDVGAEKFSAINLEDFPGAVAQPLAAQFPGLTVRRTFRYADAQASALLKASAVEPDVRVETQDTLSLGEDRTVLATTADVAITRAGIFKLSFLMPPGFDVESISGAALSHWTELKTDAGRIITLNLTGKTDGQQQFILSLSGPGVKTASDWTVPQISFREAGKQRGTLLVVPEQGMRLEAADARRRDAARPAKIRRAAERRAGLPRSRNPVEPRAGHRAGGPVDPGHQPATCHGQRGAGESRREFAVSNREHRPEVVPRFPRHQRGRRDLPRRPARGFSRGGRRGDQRVAGVGHQTAPARHRPVFAASELSDPQSPASRGKSILRGVLAADVNLQRGFATVESAGRLQLRVDELPASLQPTEWQGIPRALQKDMSAASANFAYRLVEPDFQLPLKLERHEAAKLLAGARQRHHLHLGDFRRGRDAHAGASWTFCPATSAC